MRMGQGGAFTISIDVGRFLNVVNPFCNWVTLVGRSAGNLQRRETR